jgi:hypothetical protein
LTSLTWSWRVRATLASLVLPPLVHLVSLPVLTRWIDRGRPPAQPVVPDESQLAAWVDRVLRRLPGPWRRTCLKRAFVMYYLLRRSGRPAGLRIGVRRDTDQKLAAHAWLVRDDQPILEEGADHIGSYQVLTQFP